MSFEFRCTHCQVLLRLKAEDAGRDFSCPTCGGRLTVPVPEVAAPPSTASPFGPPRVDVNPYQAPQATLAPGAAWQRSGQNSLATTSVVLGACSIMTICCCGLLTLPLSAIGLLLGILALKSNDRTLATIGIVLNGIGLLIGLAHVAWFIFVILSSNPPVWS